MRSQAPRPEGNKTHVRHSHGLHHPCRRVASRGHRPTSLPHGRRLVAVVALGEEAFHRRCYLVGGGQVVTGGFGVAVVLFLELAQQLAGGLVTAGVGLDGHQVGFGGQVQFVGRQGQSRHFHVLVKDGGRSLREGCVREVVGNVGGGAEGTDAESAQMVLELER